MVLAAFIAVGLWISVSRQPVSVSLVRRTNDAQGNPAWVFEIRNSSRIPYNCFFKTEVLTGDGWGDSTNQNRAARVAFALPRRSSASFRFPTGSDSRPWRVSFTYQREGTKITRMLGRLCNLLRINRYVNFDPGFRTVSGPEILPPNKPRGVNGRKPFLSVPPTDADAQVRRWIAVGTSASEARRIMEQHGFTCSLVTNGAFGASRGIDFVYCDKRQGSLTQQRWQAALVLVEGRVSAVQVTTGTVAP
jgi:hypothetical protein